MAAPTFCVDEDVAEGCVSAIAQFSQTMHNEYWEEYEATSQGSGEVPCPPTGKAILGALAIKHCFEEQEHVSPSAIVPSVRGGVSVCLDGKGRYTHFECLNGGTVLYVRSEVGGSVNVMEITSEKEMANAVHDAVQFVAPRVSGHATVQGR